MHIFTLNLHCSIIVLVFCKLVKQGGRAHHGPLYWQLPNYWKPRLKLPAGKGSLKGLRFNRLRPWNI